MVGILTMFSNYMLIVHKQEKKMKVLLSPLSAVRAKSLSITQYYRKWFPYSYFLTISGVILP